MKNKHDYDCFLFVITIFLCTYSLDNKKLIKQERTTTIGAENFVVFCILDNLLFEKIIKIEWIYKEKNKNEKKWREKWKKLPVTERTTDS